MLLGLLPLGTYRMDILDAASDDVTAGNSHHAHAISSNDVIAGDDVAAEDNAAGNLAGRDLHAAVSEDSPEVISEDVAAEDLQDKLT